MGTSTNDVEVKSSPMTDFSSSSFHHVTFGETSQWKRKKIIEYGVFKHSETNFDLIFFPFKNRKKFTKWEEMPSHSLATPFSALWHLMTLSLTPLCRVSRIFWTTIGFKCCFYAKNVVDGLCLQFGSWLKQELSN